MSRAYVVAGVLLLFVMALPPSVLASPVWTALYTGPPGTESQEANAVAGAADGSIYVVGGSTYTFGKPDWAPWLVKYAPGGTVAWHKAPTDVAAHGVFLGLTVFPNQDVLVWGQSGRMASGFLVARYRPDGTRRWAIKVPGGFSGTRPADAAIDPRGYIYLAGTDGVHDGRVDGFLLKFTTSGHLLWRRVLSGDARSVSAFTALALGSKGNLYASGSVVRRGSPRWFVASYTPTGTRRWTDTSIMGGGQDIAFAHGVIYAGGGAQTRPGADYFALLRAYTFRGRLLFGRRVHAEPGLGAAFDYLTIDAAGSATCAGDTNATTGPDSHRSDFLTAKFTVDAALLWKDVWSGGAGRADWVRGLEVAPNGTTYVCGESMGEVSSGVAVVPYDATGARGTPMIDETPSLFEAASGSTLSTQGPAVVGSRGLPPDVGPSNALVLQFPW